MYGGFCAFSPEWGFFVHKYFSIFLIIHTQIFPNFPKLLYLLGVVGFSFFMGQANLPDLYPWWIVPVYVLTSSLDFYTILLQKKVEEFLLY